MDLCMIDVKYGGSWDDSKNYSVYDSQHLTIPNQFSFDQFKSFVFEKTVTLHSQSTYRVLIELVSDTGVSKYVPFVDESDLLFLKSFLSVDSIKCAIIVDLLHDFVNNNDDHQIVRNTTVTNIIDINQLKNDDLYGDSHSQNPHLIDPVENDIPSQIPDAAIPDPTTDGVIIPQGFRYIDTINLRDYNRDFDVLIKDIYANKRILRLSLNILALKFNFQFYVVRSNNHRIYVACVDELCKWNLHARRFQKTHAFIVNKFNNCHTCPIDIIRNDHRQASYEVVAEFIKEFYPPIRGMVMRPQDIVEMMKANHGITISYAKALKAKDLVLADLRGGFEISYELIPKFCHIVEQKNPGSFLFYDFDDLFRFKYLFMALGVSLAGFHNCRPVLSVDGTFLKNKFGGTMLAAVCMDANNQIFPVAVAIVDSENDLSWNWFFTKLKIAFGKVIDGLSIISDRHKSIKKAVENVFGYAHYGVCIYHLANNIKARFKKKGLTHLFMRAAEAYSVDDYNYYMNELSKVDPLAFEYVNSIGPHHWARAYFVGLRFNLMTTNISESFNAAMTPYRDYPIVAFLEEIILKLQTWFFDRRFAASCMGTILSSAIETILRSRINVGRCLKLRASSSDIFAVSDSIRDYVVDMFKRTCSCRQWQLEFIPCVHVCAVILHKKLPVTSFVHQYYTKNALSNTYSGLIHPIGRSSQWVVPTEIQDIIVLPPVTKRAAGRPRKRRFPSTGEYKTVLKCGRCNQAGHNRKTCQNPLALVPYPSQSKKKKT